MLNPGTVGLGGPTEICPDTICIPQTEQHHFGLGVIVQDGWIVQRPSFAGYSAVQTYLAGRDIAIAVATTRGPTTTGVNTAQDIATQIGELPQVPSWSSGLRRQAGFRFPSISSVLAGTAGDGGERQVKSDRRVHDRARLRPEVVLVHHRPTDRPVDQLQAVATLFGGFSSCSRASR